MMCLMQIYALDSSSGKMLWQLYLPMLSSGTKDHFYPLYTLRTSSHPPHPPQMVLAGGSTSCNGSALYIFNPITGELIDGEPKCLSRDIVQSLLLPVLDHTHSRVMLYMDDTNSVGCYPVGCGGVSLRGSNIFMYTVNSNTGTLKGYRAIDENRPAMEVWQMKLPPNEKILTVSHKPHFGMLLCVYMCVYGICVCVYCHCLFIV